MDEYCYIIREIEDDLFFVFTPKGMRYAFKPHLATRFDSLNVAKQAANAFRHINTEILYCLIA